MAEELFKHNLFFDYLYNLRLVDPELSAETNDLKEKSAEYTDSKKSNLSSKQQIELERCAAIQIL